MTDPRLVSAYGLLVHGDPKNIERRLNNLCILVPEIEEELLVTVDIPLKVLTDEITNSRFIACEFNRDLDSYRSPLSNTYFPQLDDGVQIPKRLRDIEVIANNVFRSYCKLYFNQGLSSVYLWEISEASFGLGVFIKNEVDITLGNGIKMIGSIDCSDAFEITENGDDTASYKLTSSALIHIELHNGLTSPLVISGSTAALSVYNANYKKDTDHVINAGRIVESRADEFKSRIDNLFVGKINEIVCILSDPNSPMSRHRVMSEAFKSSS